MNYCIRCGLPLTSTADSWNMCSACRNRTHSEIQQKAGELNITVIVKPEAYLISQPTVGMRVNVNGMEWGDYIELTAFTHDQIQSAISELLNRYWQGDESKLVPLPSRFIK